MVRGVGLCALLAGWSAGATMLPNGIRLPAAWPPAGQDPASREPMAVPYLENRPAVVPIDVGRQLFVDDFLIESTTLRRTYHQAEKYAGNPVLTPSVAAELTSVVDASSRREAGAQPAVCYLGHGGVFFDPIDGLFRMFYTSGWRGGLSTATSRDGLTWTRADFGPERGAVLLPAGRDQAGGDNSVWFDLAAPAAERIKFLTERTYGMTDRSHVASTHTLHTIGADGRFSPAVPAGRAADYCSFFYNPFRKVWVFSIKRDGPHGRTRYYAESPDFLTTAVFDRSVFWVGADRLDAPDPAIGDPSQLYSLSAVAYESILLGAFQIHLGPRNSICDLGAFPKMTDIKLGFSRDGFHWSRPDRRAFIAATRRDGDWDRGYVHTTTGVCFVVGDKLYFPYTAYSGVAPDGRRGMYTGASIGLAVLRRDGFASMDAGPESGTLTTRPVVFQGSRLFVNVDTASEGGELRVEILDEAGKPLAPFSIDRSTPIAVDRTLQAVAWGAEADLSALRGRTVRFRFELRRGRLFAFWVSPDASGASHGYVAAGGPGYDGIVDTVGAAALPAAQR